jgi:hypothetical protein
VGAAAAGVLALAPLALHQAGAGHADWIARLGMITRLKEVAATFVNGETGRFISQPLRWRYAVLPLALGVAAMVLLARRASTTELRAGGLALVVAAGSVLLALISAAAGSDYLLARNLLPVLMPLLAAVAIGVACRDAGRLGMGIGAALVAYWLAFAVYVDVRPRLQRPDWRDIAADIGPPAGPRAIVTSGQGGVPLHYYLHIPYLPVHSPAPPIRVREVDVISVGVPPPRRGTGLPRPFRHSGQRTAKTVTLTRYAAPRPVPVPWHQLLNHYTGFFNRDVLVQGAAARALARRGG